VLGADLMSALDKVLERLQNVRQQGEGYRASCPVPAHGQGNGDRDPSLSVTVGDDGRVLLNCFAQCEKETIVEALGLSMADLFESHNGHGGGGSYTSHKARSTDQPCTLENYAQYVSLPVEFLKGLGLKEYSHLGEPAVSMPYLDERGENVLLTRSRVSLTGKPKVKTRKGDKHRLYGLWKLEEAKEAGYVWLVEGESDAQTLWYHGEPALGIPGANGWKATWASELEGFDQIYFVVEDEAGEAYWQKFAATPEIRERLYRVEL
jgi:putative DNA primase/helicase